MGFLKKIFGKGDDGGVNPIPVPIPPKPVDVTEGVDYRQLRNQPYSAEKWKVMKAFADKGYPLAMQDVGEMLLLGYMVEKDENLAIVYLDKARVAGRSLAAVRMGQYNIRKAMDIFANPANLTPEKKEASYDAFGNLYRQGAAYLTEALSGYELAGVDEAADLIAGASHFGYNEKEFRPLFMDMINITLPDAVEKIMDECKSENAKIASCAWYKRGKLELLGIYFEGDFDRAKECFERSKELDPDNAFPVIALQNPLFQD